MKRVRDFRKAIIVEEKKENTYSSEDENNETRPGKEKKFTKKHYRDLKKHPVADEDQFKGGTSKDTSRKADKTGLQKEATNDPSHTKNPFTYYKKPSNKKEAQSNVNYWHYVGMASNKEIEDMGEIPANYKSYAKSMKRDAERELKKMKESIVTEASQPTWSVFGKKSGIVDGKDVKKGKDLAHIKAANPAAAMRKLAKQWNVPYGGISQFIDAKKLSEETDIQEKAVSKSQQKMMAMALAYKRGEMKDAEVSDEIKKMASSMSEKDLEDFAKTKHKGLPDKKEEVKEEYITLIKENVVEDLRSIVKSKKKQKVKFDNGSVLVVDEDTAGLLIKLHDSLNKTNQDKFAANLSRGQNSFMKMVDYADSTVG